MTQTINTFVRFALIALGVGTLFAGLLNYVLGPDSAALVFANILAAVGVENAYTPGALAGVDADSEIRHFAVFLAAYGAWVLRVSLQKVLVTNHVLIALGLFWAGGFGRVISLKQTGLWPDPLFTTLGAVELIGPFILATAFLVANGAAEGKTAAVPQKA